MGFLLESIGLSKFHAWELGVNGLECCIRTGALACMGIAHHHWKPGGFHVIDVLLGCGHLCRLPAEPRAGRRGQNSRLFLIPEQHRTHCCGFTFLHSQVQHLPKLMEEHQAVGVPARCRGVGPDGL